MFLSNTAELLVHYSRWQILKQQLPVLAWTLTPYLLRRTTFVPGVESRNSQRVKQRKYPKKTKQDKNPGRKKVESLIKHAWPKYLLCCQANNISKIDSTEPFCTVVHVTSGRQYLVMCCRNIAWNYINAFLWEQERKNVSWAECNDVSTKLWSTVFFLRSSRPFRKPLSLPLKHRT